MTAYGRIMGLCWPESILGPSPSLREINLACWGTFLLCMVLPLSSLLLSRWKAGPIGDFVYFYGDGRLANEYPAPRLYDYDLQLKVFDEIDPARGNLYGPSPYPPFVALFFGLFAHFQYRFAYLLWLGVSLAIYLVGIGAIAREVFPKERLKSSLAFCFALAFPPFLMNTLVSGQISSLAVCSIGIGIACERRSMPFWSGAALSILTYKPTLLLVILPMLFLRRKIVSILGFAAGAILLFLTVTVVDGVQIWPSYIRFLLFFGRVSQMPGMLERWKFIDLNSFSYTLLRGESQTAFLILIGTSAVIAIWLAILFWRAAPGTRSTQNLVWSNALTWTLLFNVYVPVYDSTLAVIGLVLTIGVHSEIERRSSMVWTMFLAALIFAVSWKSESIAQRYGIQPLTVLFLILGLWQLFFLHRAIHRDSERNIELSGV
jgi:Glycosyltransferase family 87